MKILIAGSSSGIGRSIAEKMLTENHHVIGLARQHEKFIPDTKKYVTYSVDFSNINTLEQQFKQIQQAESPIDVIVCSVGYGDFAELEQFSVQRMQNILNVNFLSQAILIKTFLSQFKKRNAGKIILIGSECALDGAKKATMYCASKFALRGFAQSLRKECAAAQVMVTLINPGIVNTPFFADLDFRPAKGELHAIEANQIATLVSNIISEESNCVFEEINLQPMKKVIESCDIPPGGE